MKVSAHWISEDQGELKINLESENQEESAQLVQYAQRIKSPVKVYGRVGKINTWIWLQIPIKKSFNLYFGNDPDVVKG